MLITQQTRAFLTFFSHVTKEINIFFAMANRWNRDSSNPAYVALEQLFNDGAICRNTQPKTIYDSQIGIKHGLLIKIRYR